MKKFFYFAVVVVLAVTSCYTEDDKWRLQTECDSLVSQKIQLESQINSLEEETRNIIAERNAYRTGREPKYIVKFKIKQGTFTIDLFEHIKNEMNAIEIEVPVCKEYYNHLSVGQDFTNSFKWGSLVMDGDFSTLHMRVVGKRIE